MNINEEFKLEMLEANDKEVIDSINSYFRENEMNYEVVKLYRKSNRKNDSRKCLNHGHYGITSIEDCMEVVDEYTTYIDDCF